MLICVTRNFDISNIGESNMSVQDRIYLNLINLKKWEHFIWDAYSSIAYKC